jgi:chromosome segregation ATPase
MKWFSTQKTLNSTEYESIVLKLTALNAEVKDISYELSKQKVLLESLRGKLYQAKQEPQDLSSNNPMFLP